MRKAECPHPGRLLAELLGGEGGQVEPFRSGDDRGRGWAGAIREVRVSLDLHAPPPWRYLLQTLRHLHGTFLLVPALICSELRPLSLDGENGGKDVVQLVRSLEEVAAERGLPLLLIREEEEHPLPVGHLREAGFHAIERPSALGLPPSTADGGAGAEGVVVRGLPPSALDGPHRRLLLALAETVDPLFHVPRWELWERLQGADDEGWRLFEARAEDGCLLAWSLVCREGGRGRVPLAAWALVEDGSLARNALDGPSLRWAAERGATSLVVEPPHAVEAARGERLVRRLHLRHGHPAMQGLIRRF